MKQRQRKILIGAGFLIIWIGSLLCLYNRPKEIIYVDSNEMTITLAQDNTISIKGINHRGYSRIAPENTLEAFKLSKEYGFTYVETDISFTSDGVAVLLHDKKIDRTSNGRGYVSRMTYKQLLQYDFGSWKGSQYAGTKIPTLREFIELCSELGLRPYLELKEGATKKQVLSVLEIVKEYNMEDKITYISFDTQICKWIAAADKYARIGVLAQKRYSKTIAFIKTIQTEDNYIFADIDDIDREILSMFQSENIPVEVWTINSETTIKELNSYISGVTSDNIDAEKID